ncbi:MAG: tetratricopeptide repeat protein [Verrucomicrobiota bacterium]
MKESMTDGVSDTSHRILRLILVSIGLLLVVIIGGITARQFYLHRAPLRLARQAQLAFDRDQPSEASLKARRALQIDANNIEARRVMAQLMERAGLSDAIGLWRQVVKLQPNSVRDNVALAHCELRFGKIAAARETLQKVAPQDREDASYEACAGDIAAAMNEFSEAVARYERALKLDPQDESFQFKRAVVELRFLEKRADAQATLRIFASKPKFRDPVRRALLLDHIANFEWAAALPLAKEMAEQPNAPVKDKIVYLEVLRHASSPELDTILAGIKSGAQQKPEEAAELIQYLQNSGRGPDAIAWAKSLPPAVKSDPRMRAAEALCYISISDWDALAPTVSGEKWGKLEYLRLALFSRSLREHGDLDLSRSTWNDAVAAASKDSTRLNELLRIAADWRWNTEQTTVLWALSSVPDSQATALQSLYERYSSNIDTVGLRRVTARLAEIDPANEGAKNNLLMYSFLLGSVSDTDLQSARDLYLKNPTNAAFTSTFAFALYSKGRAAEALATMNTLRNDQLEDSSTAAYYGLFLQANGVFDLASKYFELSKGARLLPEEKKLVEQAKRTPQ